MKKMEKAPGLVLPEIGCCDSPNSPVIERTYAVATLHLKENACSFLWQDKKKNLRIGQWQASHATHK